MTGCDQLGLHACGQCIGTEIGHARQFVQRQPLGAILLVNDNAIIDVEFSGLACNIDAGDGQHVFA